MAEGAQKVRSFVSGSDLKKTAAKYAQGSEKTGTPVTIRHAGKFYNYVPLIVNGTIGGDIAGIMLDHKGKAVTDNVTLQTLFRYPALIKQFTYSVAKFDKLASSKSKAIAKYCAILERQKKSAAESYRSGTVMGFLYNGTKLAYDAVSMVHGALTGGVSQLIKDLAKGAIQKYILKTVTKADMDAVMAQAKRASDFSTLAHKSCQGTLAAWQLLASSSGQVPTTAAQNATLQTYKMFKYEAEFVTAVKNGLAQINNYPRIITKIGSEEYASAMENLTSLVAKLTAEQDDWHDDDTGTQESAALWAAEQADRVRACPSGNCMAGCRVINPSQSYSLYSIAPDSAPCSSYTQTLTSTTMSLRCAESSAAWRNYWVQQVDVTGKKTLRITANLGLDDHTNFFTECGGVGVKYDDYVDLIVLSTDPRSTLNAECNQTVPQSQWAQCGVANTGENVLAHCGVARCTEAKACDMTMDVTGKSAVYLVYHISDAWLADIEGTLANGKVCATQ